ncbi:Plastin-3 [Astathelohania contejeani]|uniref:Plastin-3 n=1 Tax=Astathelohania contejeani TaxID=164912 RepID=A0ABQ7I1K8_9MICR|nr:Plastin-3 [Thelohania contejeani]
MILIKDFPKLNKFIKEDNIKKEIKSIALLIQAILPSVFEYDFKACFFKQLEDGIIIAHLINLIIPNTIKTMKLSKVHENCTLLKKRIFLDEIIRNAQNIGLQTMNIGVDDILNQRPSPVLGFLLSIIKILLKKKEYSHLSLKPKIESSESSDSYSECKTNEAINKKYENNISECRNEERSTSQIELRAIITTKKSFDEIKYEKKINKKVIEDKHDIEKLNILNWINHIIKYNEFTKIFINLKVRNLSSDLSDSVVYCILLESIAGNILGDVTKFIDNADLSYRAEQIVQCSNILGFENSISCIQILEGCEKNNFLFLKKIYDRYWSNEKNYSCYKKENYKKPNTNIITAYENLEIIRGELKLFNRTLDIMIRELEIINMLNKKNKKKKAKWYEKALRFLFGNCY